MEKKIMLIKKYIKENKKDLIIILIYAIITFIVTIFFHEKWRDEAQAWLLARDLNPIELLKQMKYEGHPPLWHLILMPFAKLGFPYITMNIISWFIMCISAGLLIKKAPFKTTTSILILLSSGFIYLYPVISRSYCLIPLAIILVAIYYPKRNEEKIKYTLSVLLLAYTHICMWGLVGILFLFFFLEQIFYTKQDKKNIKYIIIALIIATVGLACLIVILLGSMKTNDVVSVSNIAHLRIHSINQLMKLIKIYYKYIIGILELIEIGIFGQIGNDVGFNLVCFIIMILFLIREFRKNKEHAIILITSCVWQIGIYLYTNSGLSSIKANTMFLIFIFIAWIDLIENNIIEKNLQNTKYEKISISICIFSLILTNICGLTCILEEIDNYYSDSKQIAKFIEKNLEENAILICTNGPDPSSIIPYTKNKKFWNAKSSDYYTYMVWDKKSNGEITIDEVMQKVKDNFTGKEPLYLIESDEEAGVTYQNSSDIVRYQEQGILSQELYVSDIIKTIHKEETFKIYKINL